MKLPVFEALLKDEQDGITTISWVEFPATEIDMLVFAKENKQILTFTDEEKHLATSVVMLADTPIYRNTNGFEYYITYSKETLVKMCEKMLYEDTFKNISFNHDGKNIDSSLVKLVELYTVDENKTSPFNVPKGSIIATYKVNDNKLWNLFKSGEIGGISLEGYFYIEEIEEKNEQIYNNEKMKIKEAFKRLLTNFTELTVGEDTWVFDGELEEGTEVALDNGEPVEDGEYEIDGKKVTIKDSKVESIVEPEETEETEEVEEMAEEEVTPDESIDTTEIIDEIGGIWTEIEALKSEIEAIKTQLSELVTTPVATPAVEEYANQVNTTKNKASAILSLMH